MKAFLALVFLAFATSGRAASDTDVYIIKAQKVIIEENLVTIVAEAKTSLITISDDPKPGNKGAQFMGRPSNRITVKSDQATFVIRRPAHAQPGESLEEVWKKTLQSARDLQAGREVGRIGYYTPEVVIRKNLIISIDGPGFLYAKGQ